MQACILDPDGKPLPDGQVGELCLTTPTAMVGYWRDEQATAAAFHGRWLRTGDLAARNNDGTFTLKGRLKEMYIRGGYNVYPAEVEAELGCHPGVSACAVVARPDPTMGEIGVAVIAVNGLRTHRAWPICARFSTDGWRGGSCPKIYSWSISCRSTVPTSRIGACSPRWFVARRVRQRSSVRNACRGGGFRRSRST